MPNNDNQLGRLEGMLNGLKELVEFRFDKLENAMEKTMGIANDAKEKADAAHDKANEAHEYSKGLVAKAGWMGGIVATCVGGLFYVIEHFPKFSLLFSGIK